MHVRILMRKWWCSALCKWQTWAFLLRVDHRSVGESESGFSERQLRHVLAGPLHLLQSLLKYLISVRNCLQHQLPTHHWTTQSAFPLSPDSAAGGAAILSSVGQASHVYEGDTLHDPSTCRETAINLYSSLYVLFNISCNSLIYTQL